MIFSRKLVVYDKWSSLAIHVALDNTVVMEDICKYFDPKVNIFLFSLLIKEILSVLCMLRRWIIDKLKKNWNLPQLLTFCRFVPHRIVLLISNSGVIGMAISYAKNWLTLMSIGCYLIGHILECYKFHHRFTTVFVERNLARNLTRYILPERLCF